MAQKSLFMLIDGHAIIYRAYHAFPELTTPTGMLANAIFGFTRILLTVIRDFKPRYLAVAFDHPEPTFRHKDFAAYKAHREKMPDDLIPQVDEVKKIVTTLNIPQFEMGGFEADDLIGTLSLQSELLADEVETLIVTGDRDLLQLVTDHTHVFIPGRGKHSVNTEYDPATVLQIMGITPEQVTDYKALMGDPSDNIPGVKGVGPKTAVTLIKEYGCIEKLYEVIDTGTIDLKPALLEKLVRDKDSAFLSKKLATVERHSPIKLDLNSCRVSGYDKDEAAEVFEGLGFKSLIGALPADDFEIGVQNALF
jgi:DNA polymerase-1